MYATAALAVIGSFGWRIGNVPERKLLEQETRDEKLAWWFGCGVLAATRERCDICEDL